MLWLSAPLSPGQFRVYQRLTNSLMSRSVAKKVAAGKPGRFQLTLPLRSGKQRRVRNSPVRILEQPPPRGQAERQRYGIRAFSRFAEEQSTAWYKHLREIGKHFPDVARGMKDIRRNDHIVRFRQCILRFLYIKHGECH